MTLRFLFIFIITSFLAQAQDSHQGPYIDFSAKKGLNFMARDSSASMKIGMRFQPLAVINYRDFDIFTDPNLDEVQFVVRRARLKFDGFVLNPKWVYKVELSLSNQNNGGGTEFTGNGARIVLDAVIKYEFRKNTYLWIGQAKLPGNRERLISSGKLEFVDRSIANGRYNIDRDLGFQIHGNYTLGGNPLNLAMALSMGEGRNLTESNTGGLEYTFRAEYLPFGQFTGKGDYSEGDLARETTHKFAIGASFDYNDDAVRVRGNQGSYLYNDDLTLYTQSLSSVFVDALWKYRGWSSLVEYFYKTAANPILLDSTGNYKNAFYVGTGFNAQLSYVFKNNWQLGMRYTQVNPEKNVDLVFGNQQQYTFGISKYMLGHKLKVQADVSYSEYEFISDGEFQYRLQFEIAL